VSGRQRARLIVDSACCLRTGLIVDSVSCFGYLYCWALLLGGPDDSAQILL
jgi:hypothetical protein